MTKPKAGDVHGMLTYVEAAGRKPMSRMKGRVVYGTLGKWRCKCGREVVCLDRLVVSGKKKSCGCLQKASGEAWKRGRRVKREALPRLVPQYMVLLPHRGQQLVEVFDPVKELAVWHSKDGFDVQYDATSICGAWRRKDVRTWEPIAALDLAGILERTPGVHVWTGDKESPASFAADGWGIVQ